MMTNEALARELLTRPAGDTQLDWPICDTDQMCENCQRLVRIVAAALSAAREEECEMCAELVETYGAESDYGWQLLDRVADAIRERGKLWH